MAISSQASRAKSPCKPHRQPTAATLSPKSSFLLNIFTILEISSKVFKGEFTHDCKHCPRHRGNINGCSGTTFVLSRRLQQRHWFLSRAFPKMHPGESVNTLLMLKYREYHESQKNYTVIGGYHNRTKRGSILWLSSLYHPRLHNITRQ